MLRQLADNAETAAAFAYAYRTGKKVRQYCGDQTQLNFRCLHATLKMYLEKMPVDGAPVHLWNVYRAAPGRKSEMQFGCNSRRLTVFYKSGNAADEIPDADGRPGFPQTSINIERRKCYLFLPGKKLKKPGTDFIQDSGRHKTVIFF